MAPDVPVTVVGPAAAAHALPPPPTEGVVCPCSGTTVEDLEAVWAPGLHASWSWSSGPACAARAPARAACASPTCGRSWPTARSRPAEPFTARPAARQLTLGEAAAGYHVDAFRRTALHDEHLRLGARLDRFGGWWRPWSYGDVGAEYWAVRRAVSVGDVSTLGKMVVSGPDVVEALERLYPNHVHDIRPGRSRYALVLNERGHLIDDGMICRDDDTRFTLTFTSGGASAAEMWVRDWIETWGLRVHVLDRTMSLGRHQRHRAHAPPSCSRRLGLDDPPRFLQHRAPDGGRRRLPRDAAVVHRRGQLRAPPPARRLGGAVAGAAGGRAPTSACGPTACRRCSGCGWRRATSSWARTPSSTARLAGWAWTGR